MQSNMASNVTPKTDAEVAATHFQHPQSQSQQPAYDQIAGVAPDLQTLMNNLQALANRVQAMENKRINFNTDLIGLFETLTAAPTGIPTSPFEQIKLANISGTFYIYAYNTNSKTWKRVAIT